MFIRDMLPQDLPHVARLSVQLWQDAPAANPSVGEKWITRLFEEMAARPEIYFNRVAVDGAGVIGFISVIFYRSFVHRVGTAQINELIVDQHHRGRGVGQRLLADAINEAQRRKMDEIEVSTMSDNASALRFYRRARFTEEHVLLGKELGE